MSSNFDPNAPPVDVAPAGNVQVESNPALDPLIPPEQFYQQQQLADAMEYEKALADGGPTNSFDPNLRMRWLESQMLGVLRRGNLPIDTVG